jgi:hypothetical protein
MIHTRAAFCHKVGLEYRLSQVAEGSTGAAVHSSSSARGCISGPGQGEQRDSGSRGCFGRFLRPCHGGTVILPPYGPTAAAGDAVGGRQAAQRSRAAAVQQGAGGWQP